MQFVTVLQGVYPESVDPGVDFTNQGGDALWLCYTGLVSFAHASGVPGTRLIPGLATSLGVLSADGRTYRFTLRRGLRYSDGRLVRPGDFAWTVERLLKLRWAGSSFLVGLIRGAASFAAGRARTVSGITTDDRPGRITIQLTTAYGAFEDVLALPGLGLVPRGTPFRNEPGRPPAGAGPYEIKDVRPGRSFDVVPNPTWGAHPIPGIRAGRLGIHVKIEPNATTEALDVLNNRADVFDWGDAIPPALIPELQARASSRYRMIETNKTFYWFLNVARPPFSNQLAREAVAVAVDRPALASLAGNEVVPACYLLPPSMVGHPSAPCPYGDPNAAPNIAVARTLVQQSGMAGQPVTVWAENRPPRLNWCENYAATLNAIGFRATLRTIASQDYFSTIGRLSNHPQTGFADWEQDFPNPTDFYANLIDGRSIVPVGNGNYGEIDDPYIQGQLNSLYPVPAVQLHSATARWQALDYYVAKSADVVPFAYLTSPEFVSSRIDFSKLTFSQMYGLDWSTLTIG